MLHLLCKQIQKSPYSYKPSLYKRHLRYRPTVVVYPGFEYLYKIFIAQYPIGFVFDSCHSAWWRKSDWMLTSEKSKANLVVRKAMKTSQLCFVNEIVECSFSSQKLHDLEFKNFKLLIQVVLIPLCSFLSMFFIISERAFHKLALIHLIC